MIVIQGLLMIKKILIIGGTQEGNNLAEIFHGCKLNYIISYAGIVDKVYEKTFKKRIGGFGGKIGMINYIRDNKISHVIDASHPFSSKISLNTMNACKALNIPVINYSRKPWFKKKGDNWIRVKNFYESTNYLRGKPKRIFLAIGRKNLDTYKEFSQNFFLLRFLESNTNNNFFQNQKCIISRGPFTVDDDLRILSRYRIEMIISKNSGGDGAYSKIIAARRLKIPIIIISRPKGVKTKKIYNFNSVMSWLNYKV